MYLEQSIKISDLPTRCCAERVRSTFSSPIVHSRRTEVRLQYLQCLSLLKSVFINLICLFFREQFWKFFCLPQGLNLIWVWQSVPSCSGYKFKVNTEKYGKPTKPHPWEVTWINEDQYGKRITNILIYNHSRRACHLHVFKFSNISWNFSLDIAFKYPKISNNLSVFTEVSYRECKT